MTHEEEVDRYAARRRINEQSKAWALRDKAVWTPDEDEFLVSEWIQMPAGERDEVTISKILERTIEACRVRCEHLRKRLGISITCTRTTVSVYIGAEDDPEDQWWSADYYAGQEDGRRK